MFKTDVSRIFIYGAAVFASTPAFLLVIAAPGITHVFFSLSEGSPFRLQHNRYIADKWGFAFLAATQQIHS